MIFKKYVIMGQLKKNSRWYPILIDNSFGYELLAMESVCSFFNTIKEAERILKKIKNYNKKFIYLEVAEIKLKI